MIVEVEGDLEDYEDVKAIVKKGGILIGDVFDPMKGISEEVCYFDPLSLCLFSDNHTQILVL